MISTKYQTTTVPAQLNRGLDRAVRVLINCITQAQVEAYKELYQHLLTHKGQTEAVKRMKAYQHFVSHCTMGLNPEPLAFHKVDKDGFPKVLKPWKKQILSTDCNDLREVNTLFGAVKLMKAPLDYDTSSITDEFTGSNEFIQQFTEFVKTWKYPAKTGILPPYTESPRRTKQGPNGRASATSFKDAAARLITEPEKPLLNDITSLMGLSMDPDLLIIWNSIINKRAGTSKTKEEGTVHSRLGFLQDKAGKTRVVAIGDYWSQAALFPIHNLFMKGRKAMRTDCTYRHNHLTDTLLAKTKKNCYVGTVDSTAFTDRRPILPQKQVVANVLGDSVAESWSKVLVNRDFVYLDGNKRKRKVSYSVGQPMGLYSSWCISVTTLHALVEYSAHLVGKTNFRDYLILGDDVSIFDAVVYSKVLHNRGLLGIETNPNKSTVSINSAEIAKQYFLKGNNITGFPLELLIQLKKNPLQVRSVLQIIGSLGFEPVKATRVLSQVPPRLRGKVSKLLCAPKPLGFPSCIDLDAPQLRGYQNQWLRWSENETIKAYQYAKYDKFFRELEKLTSFFKLSLADNTASLHPMYDPLISTFLGRKIRKIKHFLDDYHSSEDGAELHSVSDDDIYDLVQVPKYRNYQFRSKKEVLTLVKGHTLLLAFQRLKERDLSPPTSDVALNEVLTSFWIRSLGVER